MDSSALKFYSLIQNNISPDVRNGLNFVTCGQIFMVHPRTVNMKDSAKYFLNVSTLSTGMWIYNWNCWAPKGPSIRTGQKRRQMWTFCLISSTTSVLSLFTRTVSVTITVKFPLTDGIISHSVHQTVRHHWHNDKIWWWRTRARRRYV